MNFVIIRAKKDENSGELRKMLKKHCISRKYVVYLSFVETELTGNVWHCRTERIE